MLLSCYFVLLQSLVRPFRMWVRIRIKPELIKATTVANNCWLIYNLQRTCNIVPSSGELIPVLYRETIHQVRLAKTGLHLVQTDAPISCSNDNPSLIRTKLDFSLALGLLCPFSIHTLACREPHYNFLLFTFLWIGSLNFKILKLKEFHFKVNNINIIIPSSIQQSIYWIRSNLAFQFSIWEESSQRIQIIHTVVIILLALGFVRFKSFNINCN